MAAVRREDWSAGLAMHLGSHIQSKPESVRAAEALLGPRYPLVVALERRAVATRQCLR